jgi:hypothetical protein
LWAKVARVRAILERYSQDSPLSLVSDIPGNGTNYLPLPVAPGEGSVLPVFEPNFSEIQQMEYPILQQPPQLILESDFRVYITPGQAPKILIDFDTPGTDEVVRTTWTARHLRDGSTVPDKDFYAVTDFAASLAAEKLATFYVGTGDSTLQADVVQYRSKSAEMLACAKALRKRYYTVTLKGTQLLNPSQDDTPLEIYSETCQLQWGGPRYGATGSTECSYSFQSCQVVERIMVAPNHWEKNLGETTANTAMNVINRRRVI